MKEWLVIELMRPFISGWPHPKGRKGVRLALSALENPAARMMMITTT
jgi:hypothetical protein